MSVLDAIAARKREEVRALPQRSPDDTPRASHAFARALAAPGLSLIAEVKNRSPSHPERPPGACAFDPERLARLYAPSARAISVLTDGPSFGGDVAHLAIAARASGRPILCKDFVVDPERQLPHARRHGADAILLMAQLLSSAEIERALTLARALGMDCLVETHDEDELSRVLGETSAEIVGVNARDLRTLSIDLDRPRRMAERARDAGKLVVAESGLSRREDVRALEGRVDAVLVGTALAMSADPADALVSLGFAPRAPAPAIKLCGLRRVRDVEEAERLGVDAIGLNFVAGARRAVEDRELASIAAMTLRAERIGVFVRPAPDTVATTLRRARLDAIQIHGADEDALRVLAAVARDAGASLLAAIEVRDLERVKVELGVAARLGARVVLDGPRSGSGRAIDPRALRGLVLPHDHVLAGGLTASSVAGAIASFEPAMVDVASGIEEEGLPSAARMRAFVEAARGVHTELSHPLPPLPLEGPRS